MSWDGWSEFFGMGGYARYVWSAYAATAVVLAAEVLMLVIRRRTIIDRLRASEPGEKS